MTLTNMWEIISPIFSGLEGFWKSILKRCHCSKYPHCCLKAVSSLKKQKQKEVLHEADVKSSKTMTYFSLQSILDCNKIG